MKKLTPAEQRQYLEYQRHVLRKLRHEMKHTRNPTAVQRYIDFSRLSIICAKHGYMYSV